MMKTSNSRKAEQIEAEFNTLWTMLQAITEFQRKELAVKRRADRYRAAPWLRIWDWLRG